RAHVGVEAGRDQHRRHLGRLGPQLGRVLLGGEGVEVDHAEEGVVLVLVRHPLAQGPDVVAEVDLARGLDAGEHAGHPLHGRRPVSSIPCLMRSPRPSSRAPSTSSSTSSPRSRSTSTTSASPASSTPTWPSSSAWSTWTWKWPPSSCSSPPP